MMNKKNIPEIPAEKFRFVGDENRLRLPLTQMEPEHEGMLLREMSKLGVLR